MKPEDLASLAHRMDDRTPEQFKNDIKVGTEREKIAAMLLKSDLIERGYTVECEDFGMGNDGEVVIDSRKVNANPDYKFIIDRKEILIEIKVHSDKHKVMTFKVKDMEKYYKKNSMIAIVRERYWMSIRPEGIRHILDNYKHDIYPNFSPNDMSVRIGYSDVDVIMKMLTPERKQFMKKMMWGTKTQLIVDKNMEYLFGKKTVVV